ncbi:MAG: hypothetical protein GF330_02785 [Candidatus Eisenbacteria bacterium]|nr:hypothetical protein [Candidatus Eisenbacteria bacterium]
MTRPSRLRIPPRLLGRALLCGLLCPALLCGLLGRAPAWARGEETAVAPLVHRLLEDLRAHAGLTADFVQYNHWLAFAETDTSRGRLTLAPPDRFRLDYRQPPGHRIGSDGRYVWTIVPEQKQVLRAPRAETTGWDALFYEGLAAPRDSLALVREDPQWGRVASITLAPQPEWGLRALAVDLAVPSARPVGYAYTDEEGNRTRFRFTDLRYASAFDSTLFHFSVPEGYELFDAGR